MWQEIQRKDIFGFITLKVNGLQMDILILKEFKENPNKSQKQKFGMNKKKGNKNEEIIIRNYNFRIDRKLRELGRF